MNTLWDRTRPLCRKIPQWVTQLAVNYDFLFIRRCFAFYIDIIILLVFSISIAYLNLSADVDVISPQLSSIILTSYFLISRFISNGTTIGMRVFRLHFVFRTPYFMRVRLLYRFLLSIFMFILSFDFLSVIAYLLPFNFRIFNLTLLTIGIAVAIPTYSFLMILFSHGATSLVDRISKCRVSSRSSSSEGAFIKDRRVFIRKHTGGFLLLTSLICFLLLILNWRFELSEIFSDKTFSTMLANPIKKVGRTLEFQQFSKTGYPVLSVIVTGGDYLIPYPSEQTYDLLEVLVFLPKDQFHNKDLHERIASEVEKTRRLYNSVFFANIYQSRVTLRREGQFGPFTFTSDYKYIISPTQDEGVILVGDLSMKERATIRENISSHIFNRMPLDTSKFPTKYQSFLEKKPEKTLLFEFNNRLKPSNSSSGLHFIITPEGNLTPRME